VLYLYKSTLPWIHRKNVLTRKYTSYIHYSVLCRNVRLLLVHIIVHWYTKILVHKLVPIMSCKSFKICVVLDILDVSIIIYLLYHQYTDCCYYLLLFSLYLITVSMKNSIILPTINYRSRVPVCGYVPKEWYISIFGCSGVTVAHRL